MARSSCIVMTGLWVFLLYFCAISADNSARHVRSLHLHGEQNQRKNEPLILNFDEEYIQSSVPLNLNELQGRFKRDTHGESNKSDKPASLEVFHLNDTHQQLMVHWAGEGSDVIMCLARDPILKNRPSTVFVSYDYGTSFVNKTDNFTLSDPSQYAVLDKFFNHPKFNNHYIFVDSTNKAIFTSTDFAKNIRREDLEFQVSDLLFHEEEPETVVAIDKSTDNWKLWLTTDLGRSWRQIQEYVRSFVWHSFPGQPAKLYVQRQEPGATTTVLTSPSLFQAEGDINVVVRGVIDFEIKGDFMFATKKSKEDDTSELLISRDTKTFVPAQFPTEQPSLAFYIADVAGNQLMVAISHGPKLANLYVSEEMTSEYVRFALSLPRILCYFPNTTWHDTWIKAVSDESFADLHRVAGLGGIYIASQVTDDGVISNIAPEHLITVISFDNGGEWRRISAPKVDDQGRPIKCDQNDGCSLHLSQRFSQLYPVTRSVPILSSKSAPGLIIATGTVGKSLKNHPAVFMSHDAGLTWRQVLNDYYLFNVGDHGGVVVAVKYFRSHGQTRQLLYSTDEGERWNNITFYDDDLRIYGLMTEPGENTTIFTMFGSSHSKHEWLLIKIDLRHAFSYDCTKDDYKFWSPSSEVGPHMPCVLGRKETFERRIPHSNCYNGKDYDRPVKLETCECDAEDFECEFGFERNVGLRQCIRNKTMRGDPYAVPTSCKPGATYNRTKGYRKITGDACEGGNENHFLPDEIPCPIKEQSEFLVVSQRERIGSISLSGKPQFKPYPIRNLKNVIAIEFDLKNNCLYWADIVEDVIKRQCMENGTSRPETLVETRLESIEGMALDWVSNLLYFVDGARSAIEVIRTDVNHSGRMRKTILGSEQLKKPRGIAVHPMQGYIFWTDWAPGEPSVSRASMDGSNIKRLFVKPTVSWPNGITIDHIAERIYWVDAKEDYIASSDLEGHKFRKILMKNERVAHPFSVAVFKDTMYWDDWKKNSVFMADKDHGVGITPLVSELQGLMDLKVFAHSVQEGINACSNQTATGCTHICVGLPHGKFKCLCPDDMKPDGKSCLCASGEKPYTNGTCPTASSTCSKDYFQCNNHVCVPKLWECDGDNDCGDNSDEMSCGHNTCVGNHFQCHSGKCIPSYWRCDFDQDCEDGSDEQNCSYEECNQDQFKCNNGRCISKRWLCDQEDDCRDSSDETNCTSTAPVTCGAGEFRCGEKSAQCVPNTWRCDGERDCPDGSDEKNCSSNICETWQFTCANNKCIFRSWLCDGDDDCKDNSDEVNCTSSSTLKPVTLPPAFLPTNTCKEWMFGCKNRMCIPFWWKCDGIDDCGDGSDESACGLAPSVTPRPKTTPVPSSVECADNHFRCYNGDCIAQSWLCDGVADCDQGEDEEHCSGRVTCRADQFTCRVDGSCVPIGQVCDNKKQCPDGSDEMGCTYKPDPTSGGVKCNVGFFACDEGSRCLPLSQVCDGHEDCYDEQDEASCTHDSSRIYQVNQVGVDERSIDATSVLLYWWIAVPAGVKFQYLPSYAEAKPGATWKNHTEWIVNLQARIEGLKPYTNYNLTVYVKIKGRDTVFPPARYASATTGEGVPSEPWNVKVEQLSALEVKVTWQPPASPNGRIENYFVYMSPPIPPIQDTVPAEKTSKIIRSNFEIGQNYSFWVIAKNTAQMSGRSNVDTLQYDGEAIVGAIEGLKVTGRTNSSVSLEWTSVQGVEGYYITPSAGLMYSILETRLSQLPAVTVTNLAPGTTYTFKVCGYRKGFTGMIAHVISKTDGVALPRVPGLQAEVSKTQGTSVKLSWDLPKDSRKEKWVYGIFYGSTMKDLVKKTQVTTTELSGTVLQLKACESYIFDVALVAPLGIGPLSGRAQSVFTQYTPGAAPKNLKVEKDPQNETKVLLSWNAPCPVLDTKLGYRIYVKDKSRHEVKMMQLAPSDVNQVNHWFGGTYGACYDIYVTTLEANAVPSDTASYCAPVIPAPHQLQVLPEKNGSYIVYWKDRELPNQVRTTKFHYEILVSEGSWQGEEKAKRFNSSGPPFILKDVQEGVIYTVAVKLVTDNGYQSLLSELNSVEMPQGTWSAVLTPTSLVSVVVPITLVILALAVALGVFMWRHRRLQNSFVSFANSHYDTRSGAATFSGGDGLDEEDDSPVIRGFSDDEPLVIA